MNTADSTNRPDDSVSDQNVERLLTEAYRPETIDHGFVRRVHEQVHAAAQRVRDRGPVAPRAKVTVAGQRWIRPLVVGGGIVVVLVAVVSFLANRKPPADETRPYFLDGQLVWIDGKPYVAASGERNEGQSPPFIPSVGDQQDRGHQDRLLRIDKGITPGKRPKRAEAEQIAAGDSLVTRRGERRLVALPDGSVLYVNENSAVEVDAERQITLAQGEIFLDVSHRGDAVGARFVVQTPQRSVTALGTKFSVSVDESGTGVVVTQGKVQVTGVDATLAAGQQFHSGDADERHAIAPVPRASHLLQWTRDLMAAAESPLVPASGYRGGALVAIDRAGQQTKLSLRKYHVDVHIEDGVARTTVDQTYFNHHTGRLEGTFYFPLPPDASISRLAMYVNGRLMEGGMAERDRARQVFETIKYRALDPALLEWIDGSTFKMRVFPLEGRQEKRVILSYTQKLDNHYGDTRYRFPAGHSMDTVRNWSVKLHIVNGAQWAWACPSWQLKAAQTDGDLVLTADEKDTKLDGDIVVDLHEDKTAARGQHERARVSASEHDGWRYLMLRFRPQVPLAERRQRRNWIFLIEADGNRNPLLARVQADIVRLILESAEHQDTFAIITAATRRFAFAPENMPVNRDNIEAAVDFLDTTHLVGALDLEHALTATQAYARDAENPVLVHIGDGTPILGERQNDKLLASLPQTVRYIGVGVGKRWNRTFMMSAARQTGGYCTQINPNEPTRWRVFELVSTLNTPRLLDLRVEADTGEVNFLCLKDWAAHGEEICAIGRFKPDQADFQSMNIAGSIDGRPYRRAIAVDEVAGGADYLPRIWGKLAIDEMVTRDAEKHKTEIIELSKALYVMSPFTSLLVLENDEMYEQYNVDRGRKDHWALYPCPDKIEVVHEPVGPVRNSQPVAPTPAKPTPADVLRSLVVRTPRAFRWVHGPDGGTMLRMIRDDSSNSIAIGRSMMQKLSPHFGGYWGAGVHTSFHGYVPRRLGGIRRSATGLGLPRLSQVPYVDRRFSTTGLSPAATYPYRPMFGPQIIDESYDAGPALADFDSLIELITSSIAPETWDETGGPRPFPTNLSLVISQTQAFHDRRSDRLLSSVYPVGDLIIPVLSGPAKSGRLHGWPQRKFVDTMDMIEETTIPFSDGPPLAYPTASVWSELVRRRATYASMDLAGTASSAEQRLLATLDEEVDADYVDVSLQDVVDDLALRHHIPILIKTSALKDQGIRTDALITLQADDIPLRSVLRLALDRIDLSYFIEDEVLQVTTAEDVSHHSIAPAYWYDETLLLLYTGDVARAKAQQEPTRSFGIAAMNTDLQTHDGWFESMTRRLAQNVSGPNLVYVTPKPFNNQSMFRHLMAFVPAFRTSRADVFTAIEAEAELPDAPRPGKIDQRARELISAARGGPWQQVTLRDQANRAILQVQIDGHGRFRYERKTEHGLGETVVCDGTTLRHLYPELGLATVRHMSRFHRSELASLIPWLLPPAQDLAMGADLRLIGPQTVAIVSHALDQASDDEAAPRPYLRVHLVFADNGRLAERRLVAIPSGETLARATYAIDGTVRWFGRDGKLRGEYQISTEQSSEPELSSDTKDLVVLPMPVRDRSHVYQRVLRRKHSATGGILERIAHHQERSIDSELEGWNEEDALRLVAACYWQDSSEMRNIIARRFFTRGDRRLGFYTLLFSSGAHWDPADPVAVGDGTTIRMHPSADHPESSLAQYMASQLQGLETEASEARHSLDERNGFIGQLSEYRRLCATWRRVGELPTDSEVRHRELNEAFEFIASCDSPIFAYALLRRIQHRYGDAQPHGRIAGSLIALAEQGLTSYVVKYELARSLAASGKRDQARQLFLELYQETLEQGLLPPIDVAFCETVKLQNDESDPFSDPFDTENTDADFEEVMRSACARLIEQHGRPSAIALAWQFRQLGYEALADQLHDQPLTGIADSEQVVTILAALDYLVKTDRFARAHALLQPLLKDPTYAALPSLWRLAAQIDSDSDKLARSVMYLEKAIDLDYDALTGTYDVAQVREKYQQLFEKYEQLANVIVAPDTEVPLDLVVRAIRQADRWRSLETDAALACNVAARLLNALGQAELAWDYLTTPLAMRPNEAAPWVDFAETLVSKGQFELADRAYTTAFEAESTNAQILWDHAQLLDQWGHNKDAQKFYAQIATEAWQPRFDRLKREAQRRRLKLEAQRMWSTVPGQ